MKGVFSAKNTNTRMEFKPDVSFLIFYLYVQLLRNSNGTLLTESNILFSKRLNGFSSKIIVGINVDTCLKECDARKGCLSTNYNAMSFMCELNFEASNEEEFPKQEISKGWVYLEASFKTSCDCNEGEVCRLNGSLSICAVEECLPHRLVINGRVNGNMNDIGSKVSFECDTGYILYGPNVSVCGPTGQWSTMPRCIYEKPCSNPFDAKGIRILNATIDSGLDTEYFFANVNTTRPSANTFLEGSAISLQCAGDVDQFLHATCIRGTWKYYTQSPACSAFATCGSLQNINCTNSICSCPLGSRFSYTTYECLESCSNGYANTFTKVPKTGMFNSYNVEELTINLSSCSEACLKYRDTDCVRYEYGLDILGWMCYLWDTNLQDYADDVNEWSTGDTYIRDCL